MRTTRSGIVYDIMGPNMIDTFFGYDYEVARCHINNYGVIVIDEYGYPIDNEFDLDDIFEEIN